MGKSTLDIHFPLMPRKIKSSTWINDAVMFNEISFASFAGRNEIRDFVQENPFSFFR